MLPQKKIFCSRAIFAQKKRHFYAYKKKSLFVFPCWFEKDWIHKKNEENQFFLQINKKLSKCATEMPTSNYYQSEFSGLVLFFSDFKVAKKLFLLEMFTFSFS